MSTEVLIQQRTTPEVPLIFDVLDRVRAAGSLEDPLQAKTDAMAAIDMAGSVVFGGVLDTMATIRAESIASGRDYNLHADYGDYLKQRHELTRLRTLASNIETADDVHTGLADFYAGRTKEIEKPSIGRKIINTAISTYATVKTGVTEKVQQTRESITKMTLRSRVVGAIALTGVILAGSLSLPQHNTSEPQRSRMIAAQTEVITDLPAQPMLPAAVETSPAPEFKELTVSPHDTLWRIALNNNSTTEVIFNNNRNILDDPALIIPGQVLKIPVGKVALSDIFQAQVKINSAPVAVSQAESNTVADVPVTKSTVAPAVETKSQPAVTERQLSRGNVSFDKIPNINGVDKELIKDVVAYLIHQEGCTPDGAAYLAADFITESGLDPQAPGGKLAQWSPDRLRGAPDDLYGQISFALNVEMDRDGRASDLDELLRSPEATHAQIQDGLSRWERWGIQGNRFAFAQIILQAMQEN